MGFLFTLAAVYAALCGAAFLLQERLVYVRGFASDLVPGDVGLVGEEVWLVAEDGVRLHAWFLPGDPEAGAVLFHHGNAGDAGGRLPRARHLVQAGFSVLIYDYRGYGASQGSPSERGTYLDGEAAWRHLVEERGFAPARIAHFGESLGSGVAIELAARREAGALVVESGFDSLVHVARGVLPFLPSGLLLRHRYENASKVDRIRAPLLIAHSPADEVVPYARGRALYEAASSRAVWHDLGGRHNEGGLLRTSEDREVLLGFLRDALR